MKGENNITILAFRDNYIIRDYMGNLTAGTGTPYWYEWSVGLLYIVKMLNSDNEINNIVLQSDESQSLDDGVAKILFIVWILDFYVKTMYNIN